MRLMVLVFFAFLLAGCGSLPGDGPGAAKISSRDVEEGASLTGYSLIDLNPQTIEVLRAYRPVSFGTRFLGVGNGRSPSVLGVGDAVSIGIWEAAPEGLFSAAGENGSKIPAVVDEAGYVFVPYAGRIQAAGLTVEGLRQSIQQKLVGKAVEPQVIVSLAQKLSTTAVVVGDVVKPGVYPLTSRRLRLLDLVAEAGGARQATYETTVMLKRGRRSGTTRMENLISYPENNVVIAPGDTILLSHHPRTISVFGAVQKNELVPFKTETVTLAEALAMVGGLNDNKADAAGIFLFRYENADLVRALTGTGPGEAPETAGAQVPVVYRLDLRHTSGFFMARHFQMRDKDILYVSNHPSAELGKFLRIIGPLVSSAVTVHSLTD